VWVLLRPLITSNLLGNNSRGVRSTCAAAEFPMFEQFSFSDLRDLFAKANEEKSPAIGWLASLRESFFNPLFLSRSIRSGINDLFNF
jgi:hypothetical protein